MKNLKRLIRRFVGILLLSAVLILGLNIILMMTFFSENIFKSRDESPWEISKQVAMGLSHQDGVYILHDEKEKLLADMGAWAILIENNTGDVVWNSPDKPEDIPLRYTLGEIATMSRAYLNGYPTFACEYEDDLIVLGFPKNTYWKLVRNIFDYSFIKNLPSAMLVFAAGNLTLISLIYLYANYNIFRSVGPIVEGIESLLREDDVFIDETGALADIAFCINKTSDMLKEQKHQLEKKESARANWIAGVSHDIRTPLSMIMGYASQLETGEFLTGEERKKASIVRFQSERIKSLVNNLNLASKLEYNMQPMNFDEVNLVGLARQVAVDFINIDIGGKYPVEWLTPEDLSCCKIRGDEQLVKRAVVNLVQNCINHNEDGCRIHISVERNVGRCVVTVEDDGTGVSEEDIERLNNAPHYMVCDESATEQRHGLGLLIVKQVLAVHGGSVAIGKGNSGGFMVKLIFPGVS